MFHSKWLGLEVTSDDEKLKTLKNIALKLIKQTPFRISLFKIQ